MEEGRPSSSAVMVAMMRAAHLLLDNEPKILRDEFAQGLSGAENEAELRVKVDAFFAEATARLGSDRAQALFKYTRAFMVMRNRYAEDELDKAIARGVAQYVILGAGLDSFAYRRLDLAGAIQVFEVDYPATQQRKRTRLRELQVKLPPNLIFVPLDFETQTLTEGLQAGGYRPEASAFFSWLGVTMYLTEEAIFNTLQTVASLASGSEIVFGYVVPEGLLDEAHRHMLAAIKAGGAARGEPWLSGFEPASLAVRVKELGFAQVWDLGPEEANEQYFAGRTDGLCVPPWIHLMSARVGGVF
jgi:methyltransferase (TIGR00027 family)